MIVAAHTIGAAIIKKLKIVETIPMRRIVLIFFVFVIGCDISDNKHGGYGVEATQELVELLSRVRFPLAAPIIRCTSFSID